MTNKEIKGIIDNDIKKYGVLEAFKKVVVGTIKANISEFKKIPKSFGQFNYMGVSNE